MGYTLALMSVAGPDLYTPEWFESYKTGSFSSASAILPLVFRHIPHNSVVDVGCALGDWLLVAKNLGAQRVLGIDGEYVPSSKRVIPEFFAADLTHPIKISERFELAIGVEVAEHLPESAADTLVNTLTDLAPAILFSAAVPLQGGDNHLNEQWPEYWAKRFAARKFMCYDAVRKLMWMDLRIEPWYSQNMLVFSRQPIPAWEGDRVTRPLPLIHPLLRDNVAPPLGLRGTIKSLPGLTIEALQRRLKRH
jgi:hypothetical protein